MTLPASSIDTARILLVSRDSSISHSLQHFVGDHSWQIEQALSGLEALERMEATNCADVVLLDLRPGDTDALHTVRRIHKISPSIPIILLGHGRHTPEVQEGLQLGARQCLTKPIAQSEFLAAIEQQLENSMDCVKARIAEQQVEFVGEDCSFISASSAMQKIRVQVEALAKLDVPVLIRGESGSGKDIVARLIHKLSSRGGSDFTEIDCGASPADVLESELFGYERGLKGVGRAKHGMVEICGQGTIFLNEVEQIPFSVQTKLLQLLQQKQFYRIGGRTPIKTNVRILAASNGGIDHALAEKKMREDLYYSLSAFTLHIPSLRQRKDEIPVLLHYFMHRMAKLYGLSPLTFPAELLKRCQQYSWPGNVRELENFVKRYLVMGDQFLAMENFRAEAGSPDHVLAGTSAVKEHEAITTDYGSLKTFMRTIKGEAEKNAIAVALEKTNWNRRAAARDLSISYRGLLYKIQQYQLIPPETHPSAFPNSVGPKRDSSGR